MLLTAIPDTANDPSLDTATHVTGSRCLSSFRPLDFGMNSSDFLQKKFHTTILFPPDVIRNRSLSWAYKKRFLLKGKIQNMCRWFSWKKPPILFIKGLNYNEISSSINLIITCILDTGSLWPVSVWISFAEWISNRWILPSLAPTTHLQLSRAKQREVTGAEWPYRQWTSDPVVRERTWTDWSVQASRRNVESQDMSMWVMGQLKCMVFSKVKSSRLQIHTQRSVEAERNENSYEIAIIRNVNP